MSDKRITGRHEAARRAGGARLETSPRDERLDRLVTTLAEARPVLDDLTRARVGAKLAATTRKWAVGSAVRAEPDGASGAAVLESGLAPAPAPATGGHEALPPSSSAGEVRRTTTPLRRAHALGLRQRRAGVLVLALVVVIVLAAALAIWACTPRGSRYAPSIIGDDTVTPGADHAR